MTKKRSKRLILISLIFMVVVALSITAAFAYNVFVDYNYNFKAHDATLSIRLSGSTTVYVDRSSSTDLVATSADVIVITQNKDIKLVTGISPDYIQEFKNGAATYYTAVFCDLVLSSSSTGFDFSAPIHTALKAAIKRASHSGQTIEYQNKYVGSFKDLELINFQSNTNNIFELAGNYYSKVIYSRIIYTIANLDIEKDFVINQPCSINTLGFNITLKSNLSIHHSYAGSYYIKSEASFVNGLIGGSAELAVKTPKAYYNIDSTIKTALGARLYEIYSFQSYGSDILSDALDYAEGTIPQTVFSDLILQTQYQSFGIKFSYQILGQVDSFWGRIQRQSATTTQTLRITAQKNGLTQYRDVPLKILGTGEGAIIEYLADSFYDTFVSQSEYIYAAIDLLPFIKQVYIEADYQKDITIEIRESTDIDIKNENASRLVLDNSHSKIHTLKPAEASGYKTFLLRRGTVTISKDLDIIFRSESSQATKKLSLGTSTRQETMYYLKSSSPAFTTNKSYGVLNLIQQGVDAGIYLGTTHLTPLTLGIKEIEYSLYLLNEDNTQTVIPVTDYFEIGIDEVTLFLRMDITTLPNNLYLKYDCEFNDGQKETFSLRIIQSLADDGGASQLFESNNPFDELFMSTETNWLEGGTFEVPGTAEMNYAHIKILSIDGKAYVEGADDNMCRIENDDTLGMKTTLVDPYNFYKKIKFVTDLRFVPDKNTSVRVRCYYYAFTNNVSDVVLIQEYTITINGIFKCGDTIQQPKETRFVFADFDFYDMTIQLIEEYYGALSTLYVSTLSNDEKILLSDSKNINIPLDYTSLNKNGTNISSLWGIERLVNVPSIRMDYLSMSHAYIMKPFELMVGSALKVLSLEDCGLIDSSLYATPTSASYFYAIQLLQVNLKNNAISRTDYLLSRTVEYLDISKQRQGTTKCLKDIMGLQSMKGLKVFDVSDNEVYRFEVLKLMPQIQTVYLYDNLVTGDFNDYGTDGEINIPVYVWVMKENNTRIFANTSDLTGGYLKFAETAGIFSNGGHITKLMEEGSLALNSFVAVRRLFDRDARNTMQYEYRYLKVVINTDGADGGVEHSGDIYNFRFYDISLKTYGINLVLIDGNYQKTTAVSGTVNNPVLCSYILAITKSGSGSTPIAKREFMIDIHYNYTA